MDNDVAADPVSLLAWCLATFHTALLVSLFVIGFYLVGAAGDVLRGLETAVGIVVYLYLWGVTWWTHRRWLDAHGVALITGRPDPRAVTVDALKWGGVTGLLFFVGVLVPSAVVLVASNGFETIPLVVLATVVGTLLSFVVGAVVGMVFALLDLLLVRVSHSWRIEDRREEASPDS